MATIHSSKRQSKKNTSSDIDVQFNEAQTWGGALNAYRSATKGFSQNPQPLIFYILVSAVLIFVSSLLIHHQSVADSVQNLRITLIEGIVALFFLPFTLRYELAVAYKKQVRIDELIQLDLMMLVYLLITVVLAVALFVAGFLALIFPLIWIAPWIYLVFYPVVDLNYGPSTSFDYVIKLTKNNKGKVWGIIGVSILLTLGSSLLSFIPLFGTALSLFITLLSSTAAATLYVWLKEHLV